jgi:hypothetical protein
VEINGDKKEFYYMKELKKKSKYIENWRWAMVFIVIILFIIYVFILIEANEKQQAQAIAKQEQENYEEKQRAEQKERYLREKAAEDLNKVFLTDEMIRNNVGETVDLFGLQITVSNPFETKLDEDPKILRIRMKHRAAVTFTIKLRNNSESVKTFNPFQIELIQHGFKYPNTKPGERLDRTYVSAEEKDPYLGRDDDLDAETIFPGQEITGTRSFYLDGIDFMNPSPEEMKNGAGGYTLWIDVSDLEFLHSKSNKRIGFSFTKKEW